MKLRNIIGHFKVVTKHRWIVFKLCVKVGEPWRGLVHDLSKYSLTEFLEGVHYFNGKHSPIMDCKREKGYSKAWLHHFGRNKHHAEYWVDETAPTPYPIIPYPYVAEMICDKIATGMVYNGKDFTNQTEIEYWRKEKEKIKINPQVSNVITDILEQVGENGIKEVITKKNVRKTYEKYCGSIEKEKEENENTITRNIKTS